MRPSVHAVKSLRKPHKRCKLPTMETLLDISNYFAGLAIVTGVWLLLLKMTDR